MKLLYWILPIYIRLWPSYYWICVWSAPMMPTKKGDYLKALRVTIRYGEYHSKVISVIKKGLIF